MFLLFFFSKIEYQKTLSFYWQFGPENFNIGAQGDFLKLLLLEESTVINSNNSTAT